MPSAPRDALKPAASDRLFLASAAAGACSHRQSRSSPPFSIKTRIGDPPLSGKLCNLRAIRRIHKKCGYTDDFCRIKCIAALIGASLLSIPAYFLTISCTP
jgi:hypothetical protein